MIETLKSGSGEAPTLPGLMMDFPLTVQHILRRMATLHGAKKVITLVDSQTGRCTERSFGMVVDRAGRLANALRRLGVRPGDRVGSLAWNSAEHLEIYLAVMCMGAVLHTINLRLHGDQLAYTINHAEDGIVIVDACLADQLAEVMPTLTTVSGLVVINESGDRCASLSGALDYEELVGREASAYQWPGIDERAAASLCYTSGTTGDPKGVLYTHRAIVLHALAMVGDDVFGLNRRDRVLLLVPLFHAMGWGLPFICGLVGIDMIMLGRHLKPAAIARIIGDQGVTWSCGVPTLWLDLLNHIDSSSPEEVGADLRTLHTVLSGGTAVPDSLIETFERRFGVAMIRGWGMTEILPGASVGRDDPGDTPDKQRDRRRTVGQVSPLYEIRLTDAAGAALPHDGVAGGEIEVRGPIVSSAYYRDAEATSQSAHDGWLRTGDIGTVDPQGYIRITDRAKDVIKSGGEWISSQDLEAALMAHPAVREAAVIGIADERWGERPLAFLVLRAPATQEEIRESLHASVARWWIPDRFEIVDAIARTSTGKHDKKALSLLVTPR